MTRDLAWPRPVVVAFMALSAACRATPPESAAPPALAGQATDVAADTRAMEAAVDAGNQVVRAAGDCDAAKPLLDAARQRFDEVEPLLRSGAARTSLARLREQVRRVADMCP